MPVSKEVWDFVGVGVDVGSYGFGYEGYNVEPARLARCRRARGPARWRPAERRRSRRSCTIWLRPDEDCYCRNCTDRDRRMTPPSSTSNSKQNAIRFVLNIQNKKKKTLMKFSNL